MITSEQELIGRARAGDTEAFCELAKSFERRIYLLALHYCRNSHDAEDLSQEVWLKAYRAIGGFKGDAGFYTWLRRITIHAFLNHRREMTMQTDGEKLNITMKELDAVDEYAGATRHAGNGEDAMHQKILVGRVMQALGELTPPQRLMFLLKHREGMTYDELAETFGCSTGTVKKSLFRAVAKLRQHLGVVAGTNALTPLGAADKN